MDGVIVTVVHDEFLEMGLSGVSGFLGAGAVVVDVRGCLMLGWRRGWGFVIRGFSPFRW
ncbi:MAG: hypothetical protein KFBDDELM_00047 [Candidatus Argoarchaeum ethanivorans]|uniref:Uncharacterized protein n=1 Tax=Candidatus Argoarchaeum ethanivorans TaxID=2608793 RepID=A0A811T4A7_9EURY|nr:MAG: hypothetical protein KFBDDELM_00047 [Candidatus Argoarchaeum ethanivorans]